MHAVDKSLILYLCSPVQNCLKFSQVLGQMSAKSSILIRPAGMPPMVTSKKTIGLLGFLARACQSIASVFACLFKLV